MWIQKGDFHCFFSFPGIYFGTQVAFFFSNYDQNDCLWSETKDYNDIPCCPCCTKNVSDKKIWISMPDKRGKTRKVNTEPLVHKQTDAVGSLRVLLGGKLKANS